MNEMELEARLTVLELLVELLWTGQIGTRKDPQETLQNFKKEMFDLIRSPKSPMNPDFQNLCIKFLQMYLDRIEETIENV